MSRVCFAVGSITTNLSFDPLKVHPLLGNIRELHSYALPCPNPSIEHDRAHCSQASADDVAGVVRAQNAVDCHALVESGSIALQGKNKSHPTSEWLARASNLAF